MSKATLLAAATALALASGAAAQPYGRSAETAILYELPDFRGRSVVVDRPTPDLTAYRFSDRAQSARLDGEWLLCDEGAYGGRCEELQGDVPDLDSVALGGRISSLRPAPGYGTSDEDDEAYGEAPASGRWGRDRGGVEGARSVFFARPTVRGLDVAAGANGANAFCRRQGLGPALYFDSSQRASRAVDPQGRAVGSSTVLRDLLCRRS
jgi:hypothetical protein